MYRERARATLAEANYEGVAVPGDADRFLLVIVSNREARVECYPLLVDALAAALRLFHELDSCGRLIDLGDAHATDESLVVALHTRVRTPSALESHHPRSTWARRLRTTARREHARRRPGTEPASDGRFMLVTQESGGAVVFECFALLSDARQRIAHLFWVPQGFIGLWDLAGSDAPLRVVVGLVAEFDLHGRVALWDTYSRRPANALYQ